MAFEYLSGGTLNLFNLIFNQIFKISPTLLYKFTTIQDQTFQLILLPHVVLFLFLFSFGCGIIPENRGLRYLVMIVSYIYIVMQGWYGSLIVPITLAWFPLLLIGGLFLFFIFRIMHPVTAQKLGTAGALVAKDMGKRMGKDKQIERLEEEVRHLDEEMNRYRGHIGSDSGAAEAYRQLDKRKFALERKIKDLEK